MREEFVQKRFSAESTTLLFAITGILDRYEAQGYDLSLRQLYYQLVAHNLLPQKWADPKTGSTNSERSYKNVGNLVSDARLAGLIDWNVIKDRGREMCENSHWESPSEIIKACVAGFKIDTRREQPNYIEVMVEKQALEGVLLPVCKELDVPFSANKGYSSSSALYEAGKRIGAKLDEGKEMAHIIYFGDHDPSGIDMGRDVGERLRMFAGTSLIRIHRIALNMDQIEELKPPENPAKLTDSRAAGYVEKFGSSSWELDAIEPSLLSSLVREAVDALTDQDIMSTAMERQGKMKKTLTLMAKKAEGVK